MLKQVQKVMLKNSIKSIGRILGRYFPDQWISFRYFVRFKKWLNLKNPSNLNEKILYLSLRRKNDLWTTCADKYKVREYIKRKGFGKILVKLYGVYTRANEIDYSKLPSEFILKTNHGCGGIIIVNDKSKINVNKINKQLDKAVSQRYGDLEAGIHYTRISPCIVVEELLHESNPSSSSLIDYKIWCFNGKAAFIFVVMNRQGHQFDFMLYNLAWEPLPHYCKFSKSHHQARLIGKPKNLSEMLKIAEELAKDFPQVRVDLYNIKDKVFFGELTFTSLGGLMDYFTESFLSLAGNMIDLNYPNKP